MAGTSDFLAWVSDPARTDDQLFTVERILEAAAHARDWPHKRLANFDAQLRRCEARKLQPRYRPSLPYAELVTLAKRARAITSFSGFSSSDRPLRNLEALRFFPALTNVDISSSDVSDLSPLASLPLVEALSILEYGDLGGCQPICLADCGPMPALARVSLSLRHPWPDLCAMARWRGLQEVRFSGNVLAFADIAALPAVRRAYLDKWIRHASLRDLRHFPAMPDLRVLHLYDTASLEGIERLPTLLNLEVGGVFRDLTALAALENLTVLTLASDYFTDLTPLTRLPRLRELKFIREYPLDLSTLADCPQLRRVQFERCAFMGTEVAALNAALIPETADFFAAQPRPLGPLKFFVESTDNEGLQQFRSTRREARDHEIATFFGDDAAWRETHERCYAQRLQTRLDQLLGRGWGIQRGTFHVELKRFADTQRLHEVIQALREESAAWIWPMPLMVAIEPHGDMSDDMEQLQKREERERQPDADWMLKYADDQSVLEDNEDFRRQRMERFDALRRQYLTDTLGPDNPALLFSLADSEVEYADDDDANDSSPDEETPPPAAYDETDSGGVALAPPPPPPPNIPTLGEDLGFCLRVHEDFITVFEADAVRAADALGVAPVQWTPEAMES